jgi:hypothetical protein
MLARIQTLYLFLAALLAAASMFFPFWTFSAGHVFIVSDLGACGISDVTYTIAWYAGAISSPLTAIACLAAVFLYKNRSLQTNVILAALALFALDLFSGLAAAHVLNQHFQAAGPILTHAPGPGLFIMLPEPVLLFLSLKGVKKDEKIATAYKRL